MGLLLHIIGRRQNPKVGTRKFCVDVHSRVSGVPETRCSVFRRFLITRFNTSVLTLSVVPTDWDETAQLTFRVSPLSARSRSVVH